MNKTFYYTKISCKSLVECDVMVDKCYVNSQKCNSPIQKTPTAGPHLMLIVINVDYYNYVVSTILQTHQIHLLQVKNHFYMFGNWGGSSGPFYFAIILLSSSAAQTHSCHPFFQIAGPALSNTTWRICLPVCL
jgi:hypothetical protein